MDTTRFRQPTICRRTQHAISYSAPHFTEARDWAEILDGGGNAIQRDPNGGWTQETQPDETIYKE